MAKARVSASERRARLASRVARDAQARNTVRVTRDEQISKAAMAVLEYLNDPVRFAGPEVLERRRQALSDAFALSADSAATRAAEPGPAQGLLVTAIMQSARLLEAVDRFKSTRSASYETLVFERADDLRVALGHEISKMRER